MQATQIILASGSPRRRTMLAWTKRSFNVLNPDALSALKIDETPLPGEEPAACVLRLAQKKALAAADLVTLASVILAADTTVTIDGCILGKPASRSEARSMLVRLRGRVHYVYTALALLDPASRVLRTEICGSPVLMRAYQDDEIDEYVASGDPLDKAGAYAIQHPDFQPVEQFSHCFASVMGLPLCHLERCLRQAGFTPDPTLPHRCQFELGYICPIYEKVLLSGDGFNLRGVKS